MTFCADRMVSNGVNPIPLREIALPLLVIGQTHQFINPVNAFCKGKVVSCHY